MGWQGCQDLTEAQRENLFPCRFLAVEFSHIPWFIALHINGREMTVNIP